MSRYFDKTFFRFLFGFIVIIIISLGIIFFINQAQSGNAQPTPVTNVAQP